MEGAYRLEFEVVELWAEPAVEVGDGAHQVAEREVAIDDETLDLRWAAGGGYTCEDVERARLRLGGGICGGCPAVGRLADRRGETPPK